MPSVANAIAAAVAIYFVFSKLNPVRKVARKAPPVPTKPVIKPEILPPKNTVFIFDGNFSLGFIKNNAEIIIKINPRIDFNIFWDNNCTAKAPIKLNIMLGIPNVISIFLSNPWLKNLILPKLPNICDIATKINAVLKSTKNNAKGKKTVDEPNPTIAPRISLRNATPKNNGISYSISD